MHGVLETTGKWDDETELQKKSLDLAYTIAAPVDGWIPNEDLGTSIRSASKDFVELSADKIDGGIVTDHI
nr:hypothetical protein Iba_chr12fCG6150 [Ipomoea batatas]